MPTAAQTEVAFAVSGEGPDTRLAGTVGGESATATFEEELPEPGTSAKPAEKRERRGDVRPA